MPYMLVKDKFNSHNDEGRETLVKFTYQNASKQIPTSAFEAGKNLVESIAHTIKSWTLKTLISSKIAFCVYGETDLGKSHKKERMPALGVGCN